MSTSNNSIDYHSFGVNYSLRNTKKIQIWSCGTCAYYTMSYNALRNNNEIRIERITLFLEERYT